jgi:hypothetical protein
MAMTPDERTKKDIPLKMGETTMRLISILDCYCHSMSVEKIKDIFDKTRPSQKKVEWMHFAMNNPNASEVAEFLRDRFGQFNERTHNIDIAHPFWFFLTGADPSRNEEALNKNEESILRIIISTDTSALTDTQHILENPDGKGFTACPLPEEHIAISRRTKTRVPGLFAAWIQWSNRERYNGLIKFLNEIFYTDKELTTAIKKIVGDLEKNSLINLDNELNESYLKFIINLAKNGLLIGLDYLKINLAAQRCEDPTLIEEVKKNICSRGEKFKDLLITWQNTEIKTLKKELEKTGSAPSQDLTTDSNEWKALREERVQELSEALNINLNNYTAHQEIAPGIRIQLLNERQYRLNYRSADGASNLEPEAYTYTRRMQILTHIFLIKGLLDKLEEKLYKTYRPEDSFQALIPGVSVMITGIDYDSSMELDFFYAFKAKPNGQYPEPNIRVSFVLKYTTLNLSTGTSEVYFEHRSTSDENLLTLISKIKRKFNKIKNIKRLLPENILRANRDGDTAGQLINILRNNPKYFNKKTLPHWTKTQLCRTCELTEQKDGKTILKKSDPGPHIVVTSSKTKKTKVKLVYPVEMYVASFNRINKDKENLRLLLVKYISCIEDPLTAQTDLLSFLKGRARTWRLNLQGIKITLTGFTSDIEYKSITDKNWLITKGGGLEVESTIYSPRTKKHELNDDMSHDKFTKFLLALQDSFIGLSSEFRYNKSGLSIMTTSGLEKISTTRKCFYIEKGYRKKICITRDKSSALYPSIGYFTLYKEKKENTTSVSLSPMGFRRIRLFSLHPQTETYIIYLAHNGKLSSHLERQKIKIAELVDGKLEQTYSIKFSDKYLALDVAPITEGDGLPQSHQPPEPTKEEEAGPSNWRKTQNITRV